MSKFKLVCLFRLVTVLIGGVISNPTTAPTGSGGGCTFDGMSYANGEYFQNQTDGCGGLYCFDGEVIAWDHRCAFITHTCSGWTETIPGQCCPICHMTTIPTTTPPTTIPHGSCYYQGTHYADGETIHNDTDGCYGTVCTGGSVTYWDHQCFINPPVCDGEEVRMPGQCCPLCLNETTTPPTTIPTTTPPTTLSHGSCFYEGTYYADGETIHNDTDGCYGSVCMGGSVTYWDHQCFINPPVCDGEEVRVPGQCCPLCLNETTTPPTTTPKHGPCLHNGTLVNHGEMVQLTTDGCYGLVCDAGRIIPWNYVCVDAPFCNSSDSIPDDKCCPVCSNVTDYDCIIRGEPYRKGQVTKEESCRTCKCGENHVEVCTKITCPVPTCARTSEEPDVCCPICGSMAVSFSWALLLVAFALQISCFPS